MAERDVRADTAIGPQHDAVTDNRARADTAARANIGAAADNGQWADLGAGIDRCVGCDDSRRMHAGRAGGTGWNSAATLAQAA